MLIDQFILLPPAYCSNIDESLLLKVQEKASEVVYITLLETYLHKMAQEVWNNFTLSLK